MKNNRFIKILILITAFSILIVGCDNNENVSSEQTDNNEPITSEPITSEEKLDDKNDKVIDLSDRSFNRSLDLKTLDLEDLKNTFDKTVIDIPKDLNSDDLTYAGCDIESETLFLLVAERDNPWESVIILNYATNEYEQVDLLGNKYNYLDSVRINDGVCNMVMSGETVDFVRVTTNGDVDVQEIAKYDRIASTVWENGTLVTVEKEENLDGQTFINSKIILINDDSEMETVVEKKAQLGEKKGELNIVDGGIITIPNVLSGGLGFQVGSNISQYSLERYDVESYWMDINEKEIWEVEGLNDLCTYFAGNDDCFITLISSDKAIDTGDPSNLQNGFIYFKEDNDYKRYLLTGYAPIYRIREARRLDENQIIILADGYVDIINIDEKTISRMNLTETYDDNHILEKFYIGTNVRGNKISFLEIDEKNDIRTLYIGTL